MSEQESVLEKKVGLAAVAVVQSPTGDTERRAEKHRPAHAHAASHNQRARGSAGRRSGRRHGHTARSGHNSSQRARACPHAAYGPLKTKQRQRQNISVLLQRFGCHEL